MTILLLAISSHAGAQDVHPPADIVVDRVRFEPIAPEPVPLTAEEVGAYKGVIEVAPGDGGLIVINDVALEDYVKGIVEVPAAWPPAALQAQAIAARTYALNRKSRTFDTPWRAAGADICATDSCQVYWGLKGEARQGNENWAAAVDATAGQVLLSGGEPINATYSASNGGTSVAGGEPYLQAVDDPDDAASNLNHWEYAIPLGGLSPVLGVEAPDSLTGVSRQGDAIVYTVQAPAPPPDPVPDPPPNPLLGPPPTTAPPPEPPPPRELSMSVEEFAPRAQSMITTPAGLPLPLPSFRFDLRTEGADAIFDGHGWGHGVGMSQYGALGKAQRGLDASEILAEYYGGITPTSMDPAELPATMRVALTPGQGGATVMSPTFFRVVDGKGGVIAPVAVGSWRTSPSSGGVRVVPPDDQRGPVTVDGLTLDPPNPSAGAPVTATFTLSSPALVSLSVTNPLVPPPDGTPPVPLQEVPAQALGAGPAAVALPPTLADGEYELVVAAEGGAGRQARQPLLFRVGNPPPRSAAPAPTRLTPTRVEGDDELGAALVTLAVMAILGDVLLAVNLRRRRHRAEVAAMP
jgi:hypothetical protein